MNFWLASADPRRVEALMALGIWRGVITNPAVVAAEQREPKGLFRDLLTVTEHAWYQLRDGPLETMVAEADAMLAIDPERIGIKVPATRAGFGVLRRLRDQGARPMATVVPTGPWLAFAVAAGATMVAPYGGMLQRAGLASKHDEVAAMQALIDAQGYDVQLCAGIYEAPEIATYARMGVEACFVWERDVARFLSQPLVDEACAGFAGDWAAIEAASRA